MRIHSQPTDLVRQSIPFSYFYMTAQSADGANHVVSMYSDISAGKERLLRNFQFNPNHFYETNTL